MGRAALLLAVIVMMAGPTVAATNDFPTAARADYVFGCMASNGQTQNILKRCSCSIDVIASVMAYDEYVQSETAIRMRMIGGEKTGVFRDAKWIQDVIDKLRRAQAEADLRCF